MQFLLTTLFATMVCISASSEVSLNSLSIESHSNSLRSHKQNRLLDKLIVSSCSEMCKKCSAGKCSSCRGGYSLIANQCVLPTELKGLVIKRYGRYQMFNIDYKGNNTPIEAIGIIFALLILGVTTVFMLKKESIFSSQKQPAQCMPNMSMSQSQSQQPQQVKTDDRKVSEKGSEEKTDKPEELDKSIEIKEGETKKPTDKESRSDFEENTHQDVEKHSEEDKSPPAKDINIVIKVEDIPADKKILRRGLSRQEDKSVEAPRISVQALDQEGTVNEKSNKKEKEKDEKKQEKGKRDSKEGSKSLDNEPEKDQKDTSNAKEEKSQKSEEKSVDQEQEEEEDQEPEAKPDEAQDQEQEQEEVQEGDEEEVECPPAHRDRSRSGEESRDNKPEALKTEEAQGDEEYFENSISDRERSRVTEQDVKTREEQPRRASNKKNDESNHEKSQKPQKAPRSEVMFEESLNHSNIGGVDKTADKNYNPTQEIVLTLNEFLDKSAEKPHDTEDANASAFGFLAAATRR